VPAGTDVNSMEPVGGTGPSYARPSVNSWARVEFTERHSSRKAWPALSVSGVATNFVMCGAVAMVGVGVGVCSRLGSGPGPA
jgi:hypothetical protein